MIFDAVFMTSNKTLTDHKPSMEELISCALWAKGKPDVFTGHDESRNPIGRILSAEITPRENGTVAFVEGQIEIFDKDISAEEVKKLLGSGALSPSYTDGSFTVGLNNRENLPPLEIEFDAYSSNEASLFFMGQKLSDELKTPVRFIRVRRHALVTLAWIASTIGSNLLNKILDDSKIYEIFKKALVATSQETSEGKEIWIKIKGSSGPSHEVSEIQIIVRGSDKAILKILDSGGIKTVLKEKAGEALLVENQAKRKIYKIEELGDTVRAVLVRELESGKKIDTAG